MGAKPMQTGRKYLLRHGTLLTPAIVDSVESKIDLATLRPAPAAVGTTLAANDIGVVRVRAASELHVDSYSRCRATGSFVLIDEATHETAGAGIIRDVLG
jgi:sulfate adenylyltransferase subunit 1